jgi:hypothetical protein
MRARYRLNHDHGGGWIPVARSYQGKGWTATRAQVGEGDGGGRYRSAHCITAV